MNFYSHKLAGFSLLAHQSQFTCLHHSMSKNDGVQHFVIMKSRIFLIILGFIQSVYCLQISNITYDESYPVCPVSREYL